TTAYIGMAAPVHVLLVLIAIVLYRFYYSTSPAYYSLTPFISAPQKPSEFSSAPMPPVRAPKARKPRLLKPTLYVHDYINLDSVQKCLEDRRSDFVTLDSTTFSGELELESRPYERFF
ncbi:hypothetical protein GGI16_007287, partial [Coemansia sp. S142-1]